jgi:hypothetical protein
MYRECMFILFLIFQKASRGLEVELDNLLEGIETRYVGDPDLDCSMLNQSIFEVKTGLEKRNSDESTSLRLGITKLAVITKKFFLEINFYS